MMYLYCSLMMLIYIFTTKCSFLTVVLTGKSELPNVHSINVLGISFISVYGAKKLRAMTRNQLLLVYSGKIHLHTGMQQCSHDFLIFFRCDFISF
jgi:hypothetical protein